VGAHLYRYNANVVRQINANIEAAKETKAFDQWNPNWVRFVATNVGAWMHVEHGLGLYVFANANRRAPTNMHNNAISVNSMHRIRFAQDLALYNLTLSEEVPGFDGAAHIETWNSDPNWQGVREVAEQLTAIDDWCEASSPPTWSSSRWSASCSGASWCSTRRPHNGDFVTPTVVGAGEYDYAQRDLRYTRAMFQLLTSDREFADHNKEILQRWLSTWTERSITAARKLQPLWSQSGRPAAAVRGGDGHGEEPLRGIVTDLDLQPRASSRTDRRPRSRV
jgi:propane monooxygenase small subunit